MHLVLLRSCGTDLCLRRIITVQPGRLSCLSVIKVAFIQIEEFLPLARDKDVMKRCKGAHVLQTARWRELQSVKMQEGGGVVKARFKGDSRTCDFDRERHWSHLMPGKGITCCGRWSEQSPCCFREQQQARGVQTKPLFPASLTCS